MPCGHAAHTKHYKNLLKEQEKMSFGISKSNCYCPHSISMRL